MRMNASTADISAAIDKLLFSPAQVEGGLLVMGQSFWFVQTTLRDNFRNVTYHNLTTFFKANGYEMKRGRLAIHHNPGKFGKTCDVVFKKEV